MVGDSSLEDFLNGAGTARSVNQATSGNTENRVFANAVIKKFGNMRGKGSRGFMPVKPSGDA